LSSGEAEFYALGSATARGMQVSFFLKEIGRPAELVVYSDSSAARGIATRNGSGKVRHLELRYLWIQDRLKNGFFELRKAVTTEMKAEFLTKYLGEDALKAALAMVNLRRA
jgi:hypothetical protein